MSISLANLALGIYLILVALTYFGVGVPSLALAICAIIAGACVLFGGGVVLGPRS